MDKAEILVSELKTRHLRIATAESCTGGLLGKIITDVPGASAVYLGGVISYTYNVKENLLSVEHDLLETKGAVCEEVARQMAENVRVKLSADIGISTTGNAGPGTDDINKNLGEIYVACSFGTISRVICLHLHGNREENRMNACEAVLKLTNEMLDA